MDPIPYCVRLRSHYHIDQNWAAALHLALTPFVTQDTPSCSIHHPPVLGTGFVGLPTLAREGPLW